MWYKFSQQQQKGNEKLNIKFPEYVTNILAEIANAGGRALVVGGAVRDALLNKSPKDIDFEVYRISYEHLTQILQKYGKADLVGQSFGVIKFVGPDGADFDFSLPRTDSKAGVGHKDFNVQVSSDLSPQEAAARRDFTFNAISYDPLTGEIIDPYNGREDLQNKVMRHTSEAFAEDPLRVLRGMQFAARYGFTIAPETAQLAKSIKDQYQHLPKERIEGEFKKLVQKGVKPGAALQYLYDTGWSENFPHIHNLQGVPQDPEWHPEGNVDIHTAEVMNAAAEIADRQGLTPEEKEVLVYSALCHDFAKPATTKTMMKKGVPRITSYGHEEAGGPMARHFLESIGVNKRIIDKVVPLVENHLNHIHFSHSTKPDAFVKQLAERLHPANVQELERLVESDHSGRPPLPKVMPQQQQQLSDRARQNNVYTGKHPDLLKGADVIQYTGGQGGPMIGQILKEHRNKMLNHELTTREQALDWLAEKMKKQSSLIGGNDVVALGIKGPQVKEMLDRAWQAQKAGQFKDKAGALEWLRGQQSG
jgi:tRNA nucleotidyltransferase (CCA-adding enzyme)